MGPITDLNFYGAFLGKLDGILKQIHYNLFVAALISIESWDSSW